MSVQKYAEKDKFSAEKDTFSALREIKCENDFSKMYQPYVKIKNISSVLCCKFNFIQKVQ